MNEEIEKLIKIQGILNKEVYHLHITTDLKDKYEFALYHKNMPLDDYLSRYNRSILSSRDEDTIEDLEKYLQKHDGFSRGF